MFHLEVVITSSLFVLTGLLFFLFLTRFWRRFLYFFEDFIVEHLIGFSFYLRYQRIVLIPTIVRLQAQKILAHYSGSIL